MNAVDDTRPLLIVNADDFALTERVSQGIIDAHRRGIVTSTSVLTLTPAFERSVAMLRDVGSIGIGVHLAAVGEDPPLLSAREIPSLVDADGRLWNSWRMFLPRAAAGRIDPDDLRREFAAQIEAVTAAGLTVDHFDTHQNLHMWPMVHDVVVELGEARGVRRLRMTRSRQWGPVGLTVRALARRSERRLSARGWVWPADYTGLDEAGAFGASEMVRALGRLAASGAATTELASHPGLPDDPARDRYRWGYQWAAEHEALCSGSVRAMVDELGFRLGTYADLSVPA